MKKTYIAPETFVFTTLNTNIMISTSIAINSSADPGNSQMVKERNSPDIWGPKGWGIWEIKE